MIRRRPYLIFIALAASFVLLAPAPAFAADNVADRLVEAAGLHEAGKLDEAAGIFACVLDDAPDNSYAACQLGLIRLKQNRRQSAARLFEKVLEHDPSNGFALVWSGVLHLDAGEDDAAHDCFVRALEAEPGDANAHYFLGVMAAATGDRSEALSHFRAAQAAGEHVDDPEIHFRLGRAFMAEDMAASARLEFERCLAIAPGHLDALDALGWLYLNEGYVEEAIETWHRGLDVSPRDAQLRANLATVFCRQALELQESGEAGRAMLYWRKAQRFEPNNRAAAFYLRRLKRQQASLDR